MHLWKNYYIFILTMNNVLTLIQYVQHSKNRLGAEIIVALILQCTFCAASVCTEKNKNP